MTSASVLYMSMSLDGFITGPDDHAQNGLGTGGEVLHDWIGFDADFVARPVGRNAEVLDELNATGAVVVGRRTAEFVDHWGGNHHGMPVFVPSHRPPAPHVADYPLVTYTDTVEEAVAQAKQAAGERNVLVHGAYTAQTALKAGVLDELEIHQIPILLGAGRRLFDNLGLDHIGLEVVRVIDTPEATHIRYRVKR
jgi:dihydrofolate reductase